MATQYLLDGTFTTITEESGTIQNVGYEAAELVSTTNVAEGEGIELLPGEKRTFNGAMKARSKGAASTTVNVVDFKEAAGGGDGGSYTLPVATSSKLGGVKSSNAMGKVSVNSDGTMSMNGNPNDGTPTGTVISFFGLTPPTGYLACDGTAYNIADYQVLADHINTQFGSYNYFGGDGITTFAVPDLRGEFLRGTGTNSHTNQGSGDSVGVHQDATVTNALRVDSNRGYILGSSVNAQTYNFDSDLGANTRVSASNNFSTSSLGGGSLYTSRPTNTSVLYCIKF